MKLLKCDPLSLSHSPNPSANPNASSSSLGRVMWVFIFRFSRATTWIYCRKFLLMLCVMINWWFQMVIPSACSLSLYMLAFTYRLSLEKFLDFDNSTGIRRVGTLFERKSSSINTLRKFIQNDSTQLDLWCCVLLLMPCAMPCTLVAHSIQHKQTTTSRSQCVIST